MVQHGRDEGVPDPPVNPMLIDPPEDDHSPAAEMRRDILDICRQLGVELPGGRPSSARTEPAAHPDSGPVDAVDRRYVRAPVAARDLRPGRPDGTLDVRASTPARLFRAFRVLAREASWERSKRQGSVPGSLERDLLLLEVGRAGTAWSSRLAGSLGIDRSSLTRLLQRGERDGLLTRRRSREDRRLRLIQLTTSGREAAAASAEAWRAVDRRLSGALTPGEQDELRRLLRKAVRALAGGATRV